ncbi:hypothetical protein [Streptomyces sp. S186]|uniref:hypothetical protein n=1 Tax=Streptomyces sp. S186 TaxID=3434395 RepID=UPI003F669761
MPYIESAPAVLDVVAEVIRSHRRSLGGRFATEYDSRCEVVGEFAAVAGATVEVRVVVNFSKKRLDYVQPEERMVRFGAAARCHGHGCVEPEYQVPFTDDTEWDSDDLVDRKTAEASLPVVQRAREWAQSHAEKCRAKPRPAGE